MILRNSVCDTEILCLWYWDFSHCDLGRSPASPAQAGPTQLHIHLQVQLRLGLHNCTYIYKSSSGWAYTIAHTSPAQAGPTQLHIHLQEHPDLTSVRSLTSPSLRMHHLSAKCPDDVLWNASHIQSYSWVEQSVACIQYIHPRTATGQCKIPHPSWPCHGQIC